MSLGKDAAVSAVLLPHLLMLTVDAEAYNLFQLTACMPQWITAYCALH